MDEHIDKKLAQAQETIEQFESLIDFQRECAAEASKLWQQAHNKPDTLPDIGVLIKWLVSEIENKQYTITCASEENQQLKESLAEARAEIERLKRSWDSWALKMWLNIGEKESDYPCTTKAIARLEKDIERKNKLIEQMRVELKGFVDIMRILTRNSDKTSSNEFTNAMLVCIDRNELIIKDALSAAERGE